MARASRARYNPAPERALRSHRRPSCRLRPGARAPPHPPSAGETAPAHHAANVELTPESGNIEIRDTVTWVDPGSGPLRFLLHSGLEISRIEDESAERSFETIARFNPRHFWDDPDYSALDAYAHLVEVAVDPPEGGWPDPVTLRIAASGVIAEPLRSVGEEYGRSFDVTSGLIEERGVYLNAASGWLPWVPGAATTFSFDVRAPRTWSVVSTGLSEPVGTDGGRIRIENPNPLPDLYLVAGPWTLTERSHGDVSLRTYLYGDEPELADTYLTAAAGYLDRYEALIGPYPFGQFALVENFWETGYGMPGFTLLGSTVIRLPFIVHTSFGHEILHCWWGNGVLVKEEEGNWCEGLTSYLADYAYKEDESVEAARDYRRKPARRLQELRDRRSRSSAGGLRRAPLRRDPGHRLRQVDDGRPHAPPLAGRRGILRRPSSVLRTTPPPARIVDGPLHRPHRGKRHRCRRLPRAVDRTRGRTPSCPVDMVIVNRSGGRSHVSGRLVQAQDEPYDLDVPVALRSPSGETVLRKTLPMRDEVLDFTLSTEAEVGEFVVDPDFDLFRRLHDGEIPPVLSQTLGADSAVIVVGGGGPESHRAAYAELAARWGEEDGVSVIDEAERAVPWDELRGRGVWVLGESALLAAVDEGTPRADDPFVSTRDRARSEAGDELAWVVTKHHPADDAFTCSVMGSMTAEAISIVGRKVPHYGKYSYLFFKGGTNVGKGSWTKLASPLSVRLDSREGS